MSKLTTEMLASDEATMRHHITVMPGALDDVPVVINSGVPDGTGGFNDANR